MQVSVILIHTIIESFVFIELFSRVVFQKKLLGNPFLIPWFISRIQPLSKIRMSQRKVVWGLV